MGTISVRQIEGDHFAIDVRGHALEVDQPVDAGGTDAAPTPSELFVASLASCAAFYVGRYLRRHIAAGHLWSVECRYKWSADQPAHIDEVEIALILPPGLTDEARDGAVRAADQCAVVRSIRAGLAVRVSARTLAAAFA